MKLENAQREWEILLNVVTCWEDAAKFLDGLEIET